MSRLSKLLVFVRDIGPASSFYSTILGCPITLSSKTQVEIDIGSEIKLILRQSQGEAHCSTGYSPLLLFQVKNINFVKESLSNYKINLESEGETSDGNKMISFKGLDGMMIAVSENNFEDNKDNETPDNDEEDPELQKLLSRLKY